LKIALLCGGVSPERDVSLASGRNVANALREKGHTVHVIDPAYGTDQPDERELFASSIGSEPPALNGPARDARRLYLKIVEAIPEDTDVIFIMLHGTWGEDGKIQSLIEFRDIPYTGSGVLASALSMDKITSKMLFKFSNIPTPVWTVARISDSIEHIITRIDTLFGYPAVIKPGNQGSAVGLTIVQSGDRIEEALTYAWKYSERVLIEAYIPGRELTVAILGDKPLPVIEIRPREGFYDYRNKYTPGRTEYLVPAPIDEATTWKLQEIALKAFTILGCRGFGRIDFRLSPHGEPYCLEVNTIPGMTDTSLVPKAARAVGIDYPELCETIVLEAARR
jgi:D-alanine-D-alanine ligase